MSFWMVVGAIPLTLMVWVASMPVIAARLGLWAARKETERCKAEIALAGDDAYDRYLLGRARMRQALFDKWERRDRSVFFYWSCAPHWIYRDVRNQTAWFATVKWTLDELDKRRQQAAPAAPLRITPENISNQTTILDRFDHPQPDIEARLVRLPRGVRLVVRPGLKPDITLEGLASAWSTQRPWRIRRGIQILRATAEWLERQKVVDPLADLNEYFDAGDSEPVEDWFGILGSDFDAVLIDDKKGGK